MGTSPELISGVAARLDSYLHPRPGGRPWQTGPLLHPKYSGNGPHHLGPGQLVVRERTTYLQISNLIRVAPEPIIL
jgi:hypothetical protein